MIHQIARRLPARAGAARHGLTASRSCKTVAATSLRTAYIALGSNMGDRIGHIERACDEMDRRGIRVRRTSGLWETKPMYVEDQDMFVNGACKVETCLEPIALLDALQDIENAMGRVKVVDKGPRNIDLDILLYDSTTVSHERLTVPHAGLTEREFVLRPLAQLHPKTPIDPKQPWKLPADYLDALPRTGGSLPITTLTPLRSASSSSSSSSPRLSALDPARRTLLMAILNVTPDSFSDGGMHDTTKRDALENTIRGLIGAGADIIDIGGQSTRPGARDIGADQELARVIPAVEMVRGVREGRDVAVSIDTYRASVAKAAVEAGADMINDISGGLLDSAMLPTAARLGRTVILGHTRGTPERMMARDHDADYPAEAGGVVAAVARELGERVREAQDAGVRRWRIVLDPGIGFAKTAGQNLELLRRLDELRAWSGLDGLPWLVGASRKAFIGAITGVREAAMRDPGTAPTVSAAIAAGADVVRVHNPQMMASVVKVSDALWRGWDGVDQSKTKSGAWQ